MVVSGGGDDRGGGSEGGTCLICSCPCVSVTLWVYVFLGEC